MNHHYPDNYGYGRGTPAIPGMGFAGSGYTDPSAMTRMGQPREGYQMSHYPVMQPQSGMYGQGSFMGQQTNPYMSGYNNYGMQAMNQSSMMGGNRHGDMNRMGPGNVINPYYNTVMSPDPHASPQHGSMNNQAVNYSHTQSNSLMQQPHMSMMSGQSSAIISNQVGPVPTQNSGTSAMANQSMHSQGAHSPGHMMSQVGALQNSGSYGNQTSPHMLPRTHHVPQHPMRHPTTQQNPQEVADNILQMASAYPSNQTVQVPLKSRPAPYHIPRSPHYSVSHSDLPHTSPNQQQQSPVSCQTSPSPSSSVKSPAPVLAPIPNPIPSPGISGLRSPCNQGMSPCGTQRSPGHMGSSYSGHSQNGPPSQCGGETSPYHHNMSPSDTHYSPCAMTPTHNYAAYSASPAQRNASMYSPSSEHSLISTPEQFRHSSYTISSSSITSSNNATSHSNSSKKNNSGKSNPAVTNAHIVNSPLMSLQKLVMLPETQVVDPKSVVNDACLSSHDEAPKNADGPAERLVEGSSHSVGSQCNSSSYRNQSGNNTLEFCLSENISDVNVVKNLTVLGKLSAQQTNTSFHLNEQVQVSSNLDNNEDLLFNANKKLHQKVNSSPDKKLNDESVTTFDHNETPEQNWSPLHQMPSDSETNNSLNPSHLISANDDRLSSGCTENLTEKTQANKTNGHHIPSKPLTVLTNSETKKIIKDGVEKSSNTVDRAIHSPDRKNGKTKDDVKRMIVQCRSPGVLSEVPVITNGLINGRVCENDEIDQDCDLAVHAKLHNGFSSLVKVKLASSKRASQFARVTPCSIAVGADERAACDRFVYRRNGICRSLRTTRIIFNGRNRNDSTGNADSDESLENVSESNFGISDSPQDGNKKRSNTPKRSDCKKPDMNSISTSSKVNESDSKSADPVTSGSNGCMSYTNNEISDEDVCYYEGVDSSDIFINNCSSDESLTSSGEFKHNKLLTPYKGADENQQHADMSSNLKPSEQEDTEEKKEIESPLPETTSMESDSVSSPPSKRLRRSSGQKAKEKLKTLSIMRTPNRSATIKDENNDKIPDAGQAKIPRVKKEMDMSLSEETISVKSDQSRSLTKPHLKYPVVVLEKSSISQSPVIKEEKYDIIDLTDAANDSTSAGLEYQQACDMNESKKIKAESQEVVSTKPLTTNSNEMKVVDQLAQLKPIPHAPKRKPRKRPHRMKSVKKKDKLYGKGNRNDEVKDSFKSMKFSRTLDLMKARRRRETSSLGPFIRVTGKQNAPDTVSVFNQPVPELAIVTANNKHSKSKKLHPLPNSTTVHMVTNLPTNKTAMISSNRTISQDPWVCAFCSHHSSYRFLGDLFGPYFKECEINDVERIALEESKKSDISKELKTPDLNIIRKKPNDNSGNSRKRGKSALILKPPEENIAPPEEVWIHEACAIWSPGVCMVGNKLYGLDEAVKDARDTLCSVCKSKGAMIGCLHKGCSMKYHLICAVDKKECFLDEENLSLLCPKHKDKKLSSGGPSKS